MQSAAGTLTVMSKKFPDFVPPTQIAYRDDGGTTLHVRKCRLVIDDAGGAREVVFDQGTITVGAMEDNDVSLLDDTVSRYHCRIYQDDNAYVVQDLGSTNGTFVNGVRVKEAYLRPGCTLTCGKTQVEFHAFDEEVRIVPVESEPFDDVVGQTSQMREVFGILSRIAPTGTTVVIEGETGTGKEVIAHALHKRSPRRNKPFIVFDCSAVPANLIESELFGHEKGSFTGAIVARQGLFEAANGGTIFLDELGELSLDLQPKLLRVLETREVRRVGAARSQRIDVRVVAATNRRLEEEVRAGRFREDLFYRLSVVRVFLPALRERRDDIPALVRHFLRRGAYNRDPSGEVRVRNLSRDALDALVTHAWPGNIRELSNAIERACSFADGDCIQLADLPPEVTSSRGQASSVATRAEVSARAPAVDADDPRAQSGLPVAFKEAKEQWNAAFEREYLLSVLRRHGFNISRAAREAEIDRKHFRKLIRKYGFNDPDDPGEPDEP